MGTSTSKYIQPIENPLNLFLFIAWDPISVFLGAHHFLVSSWFAGFIHIALTVSCLVLFVVHASLRDAWLKKCCYGSPPPSNSAFAVLPSFPFSLLFRLSLLSLFRFSLSFSVFLLLTTYRSEVRAMIQTRSLAEAWIRAATTQVRPLLTWPYSSRPLVFYSVYHFLPISRTPLTNANCTVSCFPN